MSKLQSEAKIVVLKNAHNPTRKGTERHKRVEAVLKAKTVETALRLGALPSTIAYCTENKLIRVVK